MKRPGFLFSLTFNMVFLLSSYSGCKGEGGTSQGDVSETRDAKGEEILKDTFERKDVFFEFAEGEVGIEDSQISEDILPADFSLEDVETAVEITLLKGPYLQWVTDRTIVVLIETEDEPTGAVSVEVSEATSGLVGTTDFVFSKTFEMENFLPIDTYLGKAKIENLEPNTRYDYCVTTKGSKLYCDAFWTAPPDKANIPFLFVAFGDTRTGHDAHKKVIDGILALPDLPRFAINTGDLVASGIDLTQWQEFFDIEQPLLSKMAYYPVIGNHEYILWGREYFQAWFELDAPLGDELNYSFAYGNCAFVALNTNENVTSGAVFEWMVGELQRYSESGYHIFVITHHPIYTCSNHPPYEGGMELLAPEFEKYGVVAVLSGHNHIYEHFVVNGVHYFTLGGGGAPLYDANEDCDEPIVMWKKAHHHIIVSVDGQRIRFTAYDDDTEGSVQVIEDFEIP